MADKKVNLEMRELSGGDIFPILEIINKLDCFDEIMSIVDDMQTQTNKAQNDIIERLRADGVAYDEITPELLEEQSEASELKLELGVRIFKLVTTRLPLIKDDLNKFLGQLTGNSAKTINDLSIVTYIKLIKSFFGKEELSDVFQSVMLLMTEED